MGGKIQRAGFNPYLIAPADSHLDGLRHDFPEASKINRPELAAGYPPGAELLFRWSSGFTDRPIFYKIIFSLADLATACVLLRLIGGEHRYSRGVWYAWNPLVVYSFAGAVHFNSLMVLPLVGGILSLVKSNVDPNRKWFWALSAAILFGVAISIKLIPALLLLLAFSRCAGERAFYRSAP
jgi:alpha-1,6-mannosyltransferase